MKIYGYYGRTYHIFDTRHITNLLFVEPPFVCSLILVAGYFRRRDNSFCFFLNLCCIKSYLCLYASHLYAHVHIFNTGEVCVDSGFGFGFTLLFQFPLSHSSPLLYLIFSALFTIFAVPVEIQNDFSKFCFLLLLDAYRIVQLRILISSIRMWIQIGAEFLYMYKAYTKRNEQNGENVDMYE